VLAAREAASQRESPMRVVRRSQPMSNSDYAVLDKPTVQRQRAVGDGLRADHDEDLLDIPAFLRRQAD
jgi:cell division protein FtsZ